MDSAFNATSVSFQATYTNAPGEFPGEFAVGPGQNDICTPFNGNFYSGGDSPDNSIIKALTLNVQKIGSFLPGPTNMLSCTWIPQGRFPVANDFQVIGIGATSHPIQTPPIPKPVSVSISNISCSGTTTTTTLAPTTTTSLILPTTTLGIETTTSTSTTSTSSTTTTTELGPTCGDYNGDGLILASDALDILRAAIGLLICPNCVCDLDNNGIQGASDALRTLRKAVGQDIPLSCLPCGSLSN